MKVINSYEKIEIEVKDNYLYRDKERVFIQTPKTLLFFEDEKKIGFEISLLDGKFIKWLRRIEKKLNVSSLIREKNRFFMKKNNYFRIYNLDGYLEDKLERGNYYKLIICPEYRYLNNKNEYNISWDLIQMKKLLKYDFNTSLFIEDNNIENNNNVKKEYLFINKCLNCSSVFACLEKNNNINNNYNNNINNNINNNNININKPLLFNPMDLILQKNKLQKKQEKKEDNKPVFGISEMDLKNAILRLKKKD